MIQSIRNHHNLISREHQSWHRLRKAAQEEGVKVYMMLRDEIFQRRVADDNLSVSIQ